jgi:hypothetical protein
MVGGTIIDVCLRGEKMHLWVQDKFDEAQIAIKPNHRVSIGDKIWWQGRKAYLTKVDRSLVDYPLDRVGFSHPVHREDFAA